MADYEGSAGSDADSDIPLNTAMNGYSERNVTLGSTIGFVTVIEVIALLSERHRQINDVKGNYTSINPKSIERCGKDADMFVLMIDEISDPTIDYPLHIVRDKTRLRIHKDLILYKWVLDKFVTTDETGKVSFNHIMDDCHNNHNADNLRLLKGAADYEKISEMLF